MSSIISAPVTSLLDLPAEIRVKIYKYALPASIILKVDEDGFGRLQEVKYEMRLPKAEQPRFIFANKLISGEAGPLFWDRVDLDHSSIATDSWLAIDAESTEFPQSRMFMSQKHVNSIRHIILRATGDKADLEQLDQFTNLKVVTLHLTGHHFDDKVLPRIVRSLRQQTWITFLQEQLHESTASDKDMDTPDLSACTREVIRRESMASLQTNIAHAADLTMKYQLNVQIPPRRIKMCFNVRLGHEVLEEHHRAATACLSYDWNADQVHCDIVDVETTSQILDNDKTRWSDEFSISNSDAYPYRYRSAGEMMNIKRRPLIDQLIHKELEWRGLGWNRSDTWH